MTKQKSEYWEIKTTLLFMSTDFHIFVNEEI